MALHWIIGYPQLYMVVFYDLSGFIWDKSTEVGKVIFYIGNGPFNNWFSPSDARYLQDLQ